MNDLEAFTRFDYTDKFKVILHKIQEQLKTKEADQQKNDQQSKQPPQLSTSNDHSLEQEEATVKAAIQVLFDQYVSLFGKAKIYDIKKMNKLQKSISNYISGHIMKKQTSNENKEETF
mmetsp:Transcript_41399/g.39845  ORF Transcript_41399/g.39845 Transcript_41399/m.39845 type:complete len:118 (-) Transcript_41399:680-1033(-)